jgi:hypothetical protein
MAVQMESENQKKNFFKLCASAAKYSTSKENILNIWVSKRIIITGCTCLWTSNRLPHFRLLAKLGRNFSKLCSTFPF